MGSKRTHSVALRLRPAERKTHREERPGRGGPDRELARLAKALGHPARVAIVRLLLGSGECVCGRIVDRVPLAQATVSQHLKVLREAGWIEGEIDGPKVCYCVRPETGKRFAALLRELTATAKEDA